jgi:hypothetical protein
LNHPVIALEVRITDLPAENAALKKTVCRTGRRRRSAGPYNKTLHRRFASRVIHGQARRRIMTRMNFPLINVYLAFCLTRSAPGQPRPVVLALRQDHLQRMQALII